MAEVEQLYSGCDWISATVRVDQEGYDQWHDTAINLFTTIIQKGFRTHPQRMYGFEGIMGGGNFIGGKEGSFYAQYTSSEADGAEQILNTGLPHISRLDLQVTVRYSASTSEPGPLAYRSASEANSKLPPKRKRKVRFMEGDDGGYTMYIGAPSSEQHGKVYNKEVESGEDEYLHCWRYEVVYRNDYAMQAAETLVEYKSDRLRCICDLVAAWFSARGVTTPWENYHTGAVLPHVRTDSTDTDKSIAWLGSQVRPTVQRLIALGYRDVIYSLLFDQFTSKPSDVTRETPSEE